MTGSNRAGAVLTIDLAAIVANWRLLAARAAPAECAAVVKADAYGLGMAQVAPALADAGCRVFFVATLDEGVALRQLLHAHDEKAAATGLAPAASAAIFVLNGAPRGCESEFLQFRLLPVLNGLDDIAAWGILAAMLATTLPAAVHIDTGMSRLGLSPGELATLADEPGRLDGTGIVLLMSHLACADEPRHEFNRRQLDTVIAARASLPAAPVSLAASSGIFLGADWACDLVRPGAALYGVNPVPGEPNPMQPVVGLAARILQVREIDTGASVGYGATYRTQEPAVIATAAVGYADGYLRSLGNHGAGYVGNQRVPLVGRVSMDLITFDVTGVPPSLAAPGQIIELIGGQMTVDDLAAAAGTIGYEILTSLGARYARAYEPAGT
ncbi:MAG: alanine racemase [Rhodospirillales bacterium]|nr:alanine racemase [Rhodospirillales bacterium]